MRIRRSISALLVAGVIITGLSLVPHPAAVAAPTQTAPTASPAVDAALTGVTLAPRRAVLATRTGVQLKPTARFSDGSVERLNAGVRWRSSNPRVAKVNAAGYVKARRAGKATITAAYGTQVARTRLVVRSGAPIKVVLTPATSKVAQGQSRAVVATAVFRTFRQDVTRWVKWRPDRAGIVSRTGARFTGRRPGTTTVGATFKGKRGTARITVVAPTPPARVDRMEQALTTGNPNIVSRQELVARAEALLARRSPLAAQLLPPTTPMTWNTRSLGQTVTSYALGYQQPLLISNRDYADPDPTASHQQILGLVGSTAVSTTRLAYFATDPFVDQPDGGSWRPQADPGMNELGAATVSWLLGGTPLADSTAHIVLSNVGGSFDAHTATWLTSRMPHAAVNAANSCELPTTTTCLNGADLLIVGGDGSEANAPTVGAQVAAAHAAGTPVLFFAHGWNNKTPGAIAAAFGMSVDYYSAYFDNTGLQGATQAQQLPGGLDSLGRMITRIVDRQGAHPLVPADYAGCESSGGDWAGCKATSGPALGIEPYVAALGTLRSLISSYDRRDATVFDGRRTPDLDLFRLVVMLADKARTGTAQNTPGLAPADDDAVALTYPVDTQKDGTALTRALLADFVTPTAWDRNQRAADLGTVYCGRADVLAHTCPTPVFPHVGTHDLTLKATGRSEWQATGLSAVPGQPVSVRLTGDPGLEVLVRTFFQRSPTTKSRSMSGAVSHYDRPQYLATDWVKVTPGKAVTISSPYGGPLYVNLAGTSALAGQDVRLTFDHVATHPAILDMTDDTQIDRFVDDLAEGAYYADLVGNGFQAHLPVSYIKAAMTKPVGSGGRSVVYNQAFGGIKQFLLDFRDAFVFSVYRQAGLQIGTKPLTETLPAEVQSICTTLGLPCTDASINSRTEIQHVNYDLHATCGNGCSGNPFDADWTPTPMGWGESHELGHNLQRGQLNVSWVDTDQGHALANRDLWTNYVGRSGEVSNNLFPSHTLWQYFRVLLPARTGSGPDTKQLGINYAGENLFSVNQSVNGLLTKAGARVVYDQNCATQATFPLSTPADVAISDTIWNATDTNMRLSFYDDLPLMVDGKTMAGGTVLTDGWNIHTLLYEAARAWSRDTDSAATWTTGARARHGMSLFGWTNDAVYGAGRQVDDMPGNDFMLIELSRITGYDWRPYFKQHGVQFTSLANQQVTANAPSGGYRSFGQTMPVIGKDAPPAELSAVPMVDLTQSSTTWPGTTYVDGAPTYKAGFNPAQCS